MADRESIFWTSTRPNYNQRDREIVRMEGGKRIVEKVPQRGHQGDYDNRTIDPRSARSRWLHVCRDDGNWIRMVMTNAAAHVDSNEAWGQYQRAKARFFGWFPIGSCPLALISAGYFKPGQFVNQAMLEEQACKPGTYSEREPCPHCKAETEARRKQRTELEVERAKNWRDPTDRQIEAAREENAKLIAALTEARKPKGSDR